MIALGLYISLRLETATKDVHAMYDRKEMVNGLFSRLEKPALWERSDEPFWDDDHISEQMLKIHLDPNRDLASRKHKEIDKSVKWLSSIIPAGGIVLDLGCGPGLYTKRLSIAGYDVTGIDYSRRSIKYAKEHDTLTKYLCMNYLDLDYSESFDVITLIYYDYGALTVSERQGLLERVHRALKPGGKFILEVFAEKTQKGKLERTAWEFHEYGGFWNRSRYLSLEADYYFENNTISVNQNIVITESELHEYLIWNTVFTKQTLIDEIIPSGFQAEKFFDDFRGTPYTGETDGLCAIFKKK